MLTLCSSACGGGGGGPPDASTWVDDGGQRIVGIETVAPEVVAAGDELIATCVLVDVEGERFTLPSGVEADVRFAPQASLSIDAEARPIAVRAGVVEASCALGTWSLVDDTPALITIVPGEVARMVTTVTPHVTAAGEPAMVSCEAWDAYGNPLSPAEHPVSIMPSDPDHRVGGGELTIERVGRYEVTCESPGAEVEPATLSVDAGLPVSLMLSVTPMAERYRPGQVVQVVPRVEDRFGNEVLNARLSFSVPEGGDDLGEGYVVFRHDGDYVVSVQVTSPTEGGVVLREEVMLHVDGTGPSLRCAEPLNGQMLDREPGALTFRGAVEDLSEVSEVRVNGAPVAVAMDGSFEASVGADYGINTVRLSATDAGGVEDTQVCSFLLSPDWASEADGISGAVSFALRQSGVDDGSRSGASTSLGDLLHTALNSSGLSSSLHTALLAANPLKPMSCDQDTWFGCAFRSQIDYVRNTLSGPNTVALSLRRGGMRVAVRMENIAARLRITGTLDNEGWVRLSYLEVDANLNLSLSGGRPRVVVDRSSVTTRVGSVSTEFSGFSGWFIDEIVVPLAEGTIRDLIRDKIRDYVRDELSGLLDSVVGGLDISTLGTSFSVPRLSGSGSIPVSFGVGFTSLNTSSSRMLAGIRTRLSAPSGHARPSLGIPYEGASGVRDPTESGSVVASVHSEVMNHALHAVWRGGLFDGPIAVDAIGGLPSGVRVSSTLLLPPVVRFQSSREVSVGLGAMLLSLEYPGLFPAPVTVRLSAEASATARLTGEDLNFGAVTINDLAFAVEGLNLDATSQRVLEGVLRSLVQHMLDESLNDALPSLPVPSFSLPASVSEFGLPAGRELGLTSPTFSMTSSHAILRGNMGIR